MDLLESTATRADLAALADDAARETEGQLQAASDGLTAAIQKQAADFDELYAQIDLDDSGFIDKDEFAAWWFELERDEG